MRNGTKLAIDQYNAKNADCKVELMELDSQGDCEGAGSGAAGGVGREGDGDHRPGVLG
jgi:branched-chain amino acid transport system substrate-binding protein